MCVMITDHREVTKIESLLSCSGRGRVRQGDIVHIVPAEHAFLLVGGGGGALLGLVTASVTSPSWRLASERGCQRLCCHRAARSCHKVAGGENKGRGDWGETREGEKGGHWGGKEGDGGG